MPGLFVGLLGTFGTLGLLHVVCVVGAVVARCRFYMRFLMFFDVTRSVHMRCLKQRSLWCICMQLCKCMCFIILLIAASCFIACLKLRECVGVESIGMSRHVLETWNCEFSFWQRQLKLTRSWCCCLFTSVQNSVVHGRKHVTKIGKTFARNEERWKERLDWYAWEESAGLVEGFFWVSFPSAFKVGVGTWDSPLLGLAIDPPRLHRISEGRIKPYFKKSFARQYLELTGLHAVPMLH